MAKLKNWVGSDVEKEKLDRYIQLYTNTLNFSLHVQVETAKQKFQLRDEDLCKSYVAHVPII